MKPRDTSHLAARPDMRPQRKDYMEGRVTHHAYYSAIAAALGVAFHADTSAVSEFRRALARGDEHLNSIPLRTWDGIGAGLAARQRYRATLAQFGETDSLAVRVCILKAAAKNAAEVRP